MPKYLESTPKNKVVKQIVDIFFHSSDDVRKSAMDKGIYDLFTEEFYNIAEKFIKEGYVLYTEEWKGDSC
jgi:uncharacterized protein (UPF0305 family)